MTRLKDIAEKMGISVMTVSRAMNNPALVKPELLQKIRKVAEELNYVPHHGARSMASNKTGIIQVITGLSTREHYFMLLMAGITDMLSKNGYAIIVSSETKLNFRCDGIIVMSLHADEADSFFKNITIPTVLFGKTKAPVDYIDTDNEYGIVQSVKHLAGLGHKEIAFMGIDSKEPYGKERLKGFRKEMKNRGLIINEDNIRLSVNTREEALIAADDFLKDVNYSAIVCSSDLQAMAYVERAKTLGYRIPEDISVVGFDGVHLHQLTSPQLTTVYQPVYEIGQTLADVLMQRIIKPDRKLEHRLFKLELKVGKSTKKL